MLLAETRQELIAALEQKEATLLCLLDKQVEIREQILLEQRMELAAARARALAAKEEGTSDSDRNKNSLHLFFYLYTSVSSLILLDL